MLQKRNRVLSSEPTATSIKIAKRKLIPLHCDCCINRLFTADLYYDAIKQILILGSAFHHILLCSWVFSYHLKVYETSGNCISCVPFCTVRSRSSTLLYTVRGRPCYCITGKELCHVLRYAVQGRPYRYYNTGKELCHVLWYSNVRGKGRPSRTCNTGKELCHVQ